MKVYFLLKKFVFMILLGMSMSCCMDKNGNIEHETYIYSTPEQTNDGWQTGSLSEVGIDQTPIVEMVNYIENTSNDQIQDILIFKDNKLVFEKYFSALSYSDSPPSLGSSSITYNMNMKHWWASGTKSVTSVLFGIAVDKGFIGSDMNARIPTYFANYSTVLTGDKANITVKNLLTMSSGLAWDESSYPFGDSRNDVTRLFQESDPINFILSKNLESNPGTTFHYNSGVTNLLAEIIRQKSGLDVLQFAKEYLFVPLGITQYEWQRLSGNYYFASGGLSLRPRDMAKIGQLFLSRGKWNDNQILSEEWIEESTQNYIDPNMPFADGYGYQWWIKSGEVSGNTIINYFFAAGLGEQLMFVVPDIKLIVIFNCGYFNTTIAISPYQLIDDYIVPALFPNK